MPRIQVYLPDDLYAEVKGRGLKASELLQEAVRAELKRQELSAAADRYIEELRAEVGPPSRRSQARADALVESLRRSPDARRAG